MHLHMRLTRRLPTGRRWRNLRRQSLRLITAPTPLRMTATNSTTWLLALAVLPLGCADLGCPEGTFLDRTSGTCVGARDIGLPDMGIDQSEDAGTDGDALADPDAGPCGGPCGGGTPLCSPATDQCVECLTWSDCGGATPYCIAGACVACLSSLSCDAAAPVCREGTCAACAVRTECASQPGHPACNPVTGECVACDAANEAADCGDTPLTPRCSAQQECVQCRGGTAALDCTSASASRCSGGACVACESNAHCNHVPGKPHCRDGTCVECTPVTEATDCGDESCDPATRTCSGITRASRRVCEPCVSDSDCTQINGTFRCIPMFYQGTPKGGYCMRAAPGCARPYLVPITSTSLSGAASATYCGIDQSSVSCEAVNALRSSQTCPSGNASECPGPGALCETVGAFDDRCTYTCGIADHCPIGVSCGAGYCGS